MTILCEPDHNAAAYLVSELRAPVRTVSSLADAAMNIVDSPDEDLVVIGSGVSLDQAVAFSDQLRSSHPGVAVVLVRDEANAEQLARTADAGIALVSATSADGALSDAVARVRGGVSGMPTSTGDEPPGRIVAICGTKGGTGKTTVAANLAVALSGRVGGVCLVDLDLDRGDVAISVGLAPRRSLADLPLVRGVGAGSDPLDGVLTHWREGLDCVLAPAEPERAELIALPAVQATLRELRNRYQVVLVDTVSRLSEQLFAVLDVADQHILITTPDMAALKDLRISLDRLDLLGYDPHSRALLLNQTASDIGLLPEEAAEALGVGFDERIPFSRDVLRSTNRGEPIMLRDRKHAVSSAISRIADHVVLAQAARPHRRFPLATSWRRSS